MGADIHMVLEQKTDNGWVGINDFPYFEPHALYSREKLGYISWNARERNYERFAALAGVRGDGPEPKGLPNDVSSLALLRLGQWDSDAHSTTWYPLNEAISIFDQTSGEDEVTKAVTAKLTNEANNIPSCLRWFALEQEDVEKNEYRLIIWFDN